MSECVDKVVYVGGCEERFSGELVLVVTASSSDHTDRAVHPVFVVLCAGGDRIEL